MQIGVERLVGKAGKVKGLLIRKRQGQWGYKSTPSPLKLMEFDRTNLQKEEKRDASGNLKQQSKSHHQKSVWFSHLPKFGSGVISYTWELAGTKIYPQIFLTRL